MENEKQLYGASRLHNICSKVQQSLPQVDRAGLIELHLALATDAMEELYRIIQISKAEREIENAKFRINDLTEEIKALRRPEEKVNANE